MNTIGIRREDAKKRFERRAPLIPMHIEELRARFPDACFVVESGMGGPYTRAFTDAEYMTSGAAVAPISAADVILGIKETPIQALLPNRAYAFFSHTYKGQPHNLSMLRKLLNLNCTLIDYELIVEDVPDSEYVLDRHHRLVYFGQYAGYAGAIDTLYALGQQLRAAGIDSPFNTLRRAMDYHHGEGYGLFKAAIEAMHALGDCIRRDGLPDALAPLVIGFTGGGNVAKAVRYVCEHLPFIELQPQQLLDFQPDEAEARQHVYLVQFRRADREMPLFEHYLRQLTVLMNGIKWKPHQHRIVTRPFLHALYSGEHPRLRVIGDVSCDPNGSIEVSHPTYPDQPIYTYQPQRDDLTRPWDEDQFRQTCTYGAEPGGLVVMAVTNLPAEFPRDASSAFSQMLKKFVPELLLTDFSQPFEELAMSRQLKRAVIAHQGQLAPDFAGLEAKLPRRVLLLGAGLMSPAVISYLNGHEFEVIVADADLEQARRRVAGYENATAVHLPVDEAHRGQLLDYLQQVDVAISLLPAALHATIARLCIEARTHLVTASYVSPEMRALDAEAQAAGVILLNEVGLDPGLDHMSAMRVIDTVHAEGGHIRRFTSYCGGLPNPDVADNPLRFKASWSPAGIVSAANRPASFRQDGQTHMVQPRQLFDAPLLFHFEGIPFMAEAYPNGDSEAYIGAYGLDEAETFIRGTLRYAGWCGIIARLHDLGWFTQQPAADVVRVTLADDKMTAEQQAAVEWLGLSSAPAEALAAQDYLLACFKSQRGLSYAPGERDLVLMRHTFDVERDGQQERLVSSLTAVGESGGLSAMASTVGLTSAICARLIGEKRYTRAGVQIPVTADLYEPVLDEMARYGFAFEETRTNVPAGEQP